MKKILVIIVVLIMLTACSPAKSEVYTNLDSTKIALENELIQANKELSALKSATPVVIVKEITQTPNGHT